MRFVLALLGCLVACTASASRAPAASGSDFAVVSSPHIAGGVLESVSATGPANAWAVGYVRTAGGYAALAEHWNGSAWSRAKLPALGAARLSGVDAVSPVLAWAVGVQYGPLFEHTLVLRWNGKVWAKVAGFDQQKESGLTSVGALDAAHAWTGGYLGQSLYESDVWTGSVWKSVSQAWTHRSQGSEIDGIYAASRSAVWEVGSSAGPGAGAMESTPYALRFNGARWMQTTLPSGGFSAVPRAVSGLGATSVWAAGYVQPTAAGSRLANQPAIWHSNGASWTYSRPFATYSTSHSLAGIAAVGSANVWAVGLRMTTAGERTLIVHWDGSRWSDLGGPDVGSGDNDLNGVSRVPGSATQVWAVGEASGSPLIVHHA